jgi:hypothetical protein
MAKMDYRLLSIVSLASFRELFYPHHILIVLEYRTQHQIHRLIAAAGTVQQLM